jgi:Icc-related predicted phosphoesterase
MRTSAPKKPSLTVYGNFDPVELDDFLTKAARDKMSEHQVAQILGIELHRAIYAMRLGRRAFREAAIKGVLMKART